MLSLTNKMYYINGIRRSLIPKKSFANYTTDTSFKTKPYKLHKLTTGPNTEIKLSKEDALKYYNQMKLIRRIEVASGNLYKEKLIRGFCHLYSGQEAVAVGIKAAMRPQDDAITAYRAHGWTYVMGVEPVGILAELMGKQSGCARGKGGSMHMYSENFYGGNGIVGAQVPLGVGIALANKYLGKNGVSMVMYGDGAANQGQVFESYNIAYLWKLPVVFVCENNGYGMGTSTKRASSNPNYYTRGDYIPGIWADGMDVLAVREATRFAIDHIVSGKEPIIIEVATYRYSGHSMSDPGTSYRTRDEVQEVIKTRDPIKSFKDKIISANLVTADDIKKLDVETKAIVNEAIKAAKNDKEIDFHELSADVYKANYIKSVRSVDSFNLLEHKNIEKAFGK